MRDPKTVIEALLRKTVKNGCSPQEASAARAKAEEMCKTHHISLAEMEARANSTGTRSRFGFKNDFYDDDGFADFKAKPSGFTFDAAAFAAAMAMLKEGLRREAKRSAAENKARRERDEAKNREGVKREQHKAGYGGTPKFKTIREAAEYYLKAGYTAAQTVIKVREHFPEAKTSMASVRWYMTKLRQKG